MDTFYEFELINNKVLIDKHEIENIYNSINTNFLFILFCISCLSSFLIFYKRPSIEKKYLILPSYENYVNDSINISEGRLV